MTALLILLLLLSIILSVAAATLIKENSYERTSFTAACNNLTKAMRRLAMAFNGEKDIEDN